MKPEKLSNEERDLKILDHVLRFVLSDDTESVSEESQDKMNALIDALQRRERRRRVARIYVPVAAVAILLVSLSITFTHKFLDPGKIDCVNSGHVAMNVGLPDGTEVWINPGSSISYDKNFNQEDRHVSLQGDAYFDVAHDEEKPFVVDAGGFRIKVLGTVFNVQKSEDRRFVEVSLAEGSIAMQNPDGVELVRIRPGQQVVFDTENTCLEVRDVPVGDMLKKHYGVVSLRESTIAEILKEIESTHHIKVEASSPDDSLTYNFCYQITSDIDNVVDGLRFTCKDQEFTIIR